MARKTPSPSVPPTKPIEIGYQLTQEKPTDLESLQPLEHPAIQPLVMVVAPLRLVRVAIRHLQVLPFAIGYA